MGFNVRNDMVPSMTTIYTDVTCDKCGKEPLRHHGINPASSMQYDNVLLLELHGGYGMFIDPMNYPREGHDPSTTWILCHECAHALAEWLGVDVHNWHTHVPGGPQHADHHDSATS